MSYPQAHLLRSSCRPHSLLAIVIWALLSSSGPSFAIIPGVHAEVDHAFDRLNEAIGNARNAALAIEYQTNVDVSDRLNQIDSIVKSAIDQVRALEKDAIEQARQIVDQAIAAVMTLEKALIRDLQKAIDAAECAAIRTLNQTLPEALGSIGRVLGANRIEISAPLLYEGEQQSFLCNDDKCRLKKTFDIETPYSTTYRAIKQYLLNRLDLARDDTPRYTLVVTYSLIAVLAKKTMCFFPGVEADYLREYTYYANKVQAWTIVPETKR